MRDELRTYLVQHLGDPDAVLVLDETGVLKQGRPSAGVARHYRGTASKVENCQIGVLMAYASRRGHALLARDLDLPAEGTRDLDRCRQAGIPADRHCATKPQLARQLRARAFAADVPATGVTADRVYGDDRRLRQGLAAGPQAYGLAVSGKEAVWLGWRQRQVKTILAALPAEGWSRLSAGDGTKGPR